ncbi:MAG: hypothetical protein ACRD1N_11820 [Terriglobia bacterium]
MDTERTIQFILEMQAKHEVWLQNHEEAMRRLDERFDRTDGMIRQLAEVCMTLARHAEDTDRRIQDTDRLIRELTQAQAQGEHKLNALIETVDKLVRRNGSAKGE